MTNKGIIDRILENKHNREALGILKQLVNDHFRDATPETKGLITALVVYVVGRIADALGVSDEDVERVAEKEPIVALISAERDLRSNAIQSGDLLIYLNKSDELN